MMTKAVYLHVSACSCVCVCVCVWMSPTVMQEPGAYTAQTDKSFRIPRPLHRSSRGQPNITNHPGESVVFLPFAVLPSYSHASSLPGRLGSSRVDLPWKCTRDFCTWNMPASAVRMLRECRQGWETHIWTMSF